MRMLRRADQAHRSIALQGFDERIERMRRGDRVQDEVERPRLLFHLIRVFGNHDFIRAEALGIIRLAWRCREEDCVRAERMSELQSHVPKSAETDDADFLSLANLPVPQRRI